MKLVQRFIHDFAISPLLDRVSTAAAGGIPGRTGTSLSLALHTLIAQRRRLRLPLRILYVYLSKCFMTFSRSHGMSAASYYGLPLAARKARCALYQSLTGRFETVFPAWGPLRRCRDTHGCSLLQAHARAASLITSCGQSGSRRGAPPSPRVPLGLLAVLYRRVICLPASRVRRLTALYRIPHDDALYRRPPRRAFESAILVDHQEEDAGYHCQHHGGDGD